VSKQQIAAEWRRAVPAQAAAEALLDARLPEDAVSRAYYAVLHAARSVLFAHETVPRTHKGVRRLFGRELVDTAEIEPEWAKIIARLQDRREDADYDASVQIEPEQARELVNQSKRFIERMSAYLTSKGIAVSHGRD
jgi:uncharacterized protein (UPF0332 family)